MRCVGTSTTATPPGLWSTRCSFPVCRLPSRITVTLRWPLIWHSLIAPKINSWYIRNTLIAHWQTLKSFQTVYYYLFLRFVTQGVYIMGNEGKDEIQPITSLCKEAPADWVCAGGSGEQVVHLPYSSGTTGLPKGVEITASNWLAVLSSIGWEMETLSYI